MKFYRPHPEADPSATDLITNRRAFVQRLNTAIGSPTEDEGKFQAEFVAGEITYDEMVSYVRLAEYKIASASKESSGMAL